jgi:ubiquitin-protein ligase E3 B
MFNFNFSGKFCSNLATVNIDSSAGQRQLSAWLGVLIAFTGTATWKVFKKPELSSLAPGMEKLCQTFLSHLVSSASLMQRLRTVLLKGLAGPTGSSIIKKTVLTAVLTLAVRPIASDKQVSGLVLHILSVPGLVQHSSVDLAKIMFIQNGLFAKVISLLASDQQLKIHFNSLEGSYALCLTANMIDLTSLLQDQEQQQPTAIVFLDLVSVLKRLLDACGQYVTAKQSNLSHWHPVLGWFSVSMDSHLQNSMTIVRNQLAKLWSPICLKYFTLPLVQTVNKLPAPPPPPVPQLSSPSDSHLHDYEASSSSSSSSGLSSGTSAKQFFKKALEKTIQLNNTSDHHSASPILLRQTPVHIKLGSPDCHTISAVCAMFTSALKTLTQIKLEILAGLCYGDVLLPNLWTLFQSLGPSCGQKAFIDLLAVNPKATSPEFQLLILFADCMAHLLTILDDREMYETQKPFALGHFVTLSTIINQFLFKAIWSNLMVDTKSPLFLSLHSLLCVLYRRDNRRPFTRANHWLVKDVKAKEVISEMDKGRRAAALLIQKLPHIIPHSDRVVLFRRNISSDKSNLGVLHEDSASARSTLVTIHRARIVEDGYRQLSTLNAQDLKGIIRVKFVNIQGLDEAGIDQDGVFKEFLEETIKKVFDPGLNLFCGTSEERLYPSPTSHLTDNHLCLFEFVGKMIGKAVYEGIVVDVPFALFFVSQILGKDHAVAYYSYVDELPSLDAELYKQLTYVKHYDGDVSDLGLTFSFDQDVLGQVVTHELIPGGRGINVTSTNRISYIHQIAQFRMHTQIKKQVAAFARGFKTLISPEWLNLFSPPEVIRLISGDNSPLDLKDLRKHTHYFGGFHDSHRIVAWLWDILEKDFDVRERAAFLKFVTSCSKPPLLGFQHLEPPFSIRCVEVGDDEDTGDTVGSVLRGFLAMKGRRDPVNRLPTASTCFNLLKLPNYQKRSTLKEKLRYAVMSNTGFELS